MWVHHFDFKGLESTIVSDNYNVEKSILLSTYEYESQQLVAALLTKKWFPEGQ